MTANTVLNTGTGGDTIATDDMTTAKAQRIKIITGATGVDGGNMSRSNPIAIESVNTNRTYISYFANGSAAGTSGTETAITLSKTFMDGTAAVAAAASITPTSGKRFRITSITFGSRGNATATAQVTNFNLRINSASATTTSSAVAISAATATPATSSAWDRFYVALGEDGPEIVGGGTLTFGVTAAATYTTNAPTWSVTITGYEY